MTNARAAPKQYAPGTWQGVRNVHTLRDQFMDAERRAAIAKRIRQLREDSPHTQPDVAAHVGLGLRGYQKWEETGGINLAQAEQLAELHSKWAGEGVTAQFIMGKSETLVELERERADQSQLDRIEAMLTEVLARMDEHQLTLPTPREVGERVARRRAGKLEPKPEAPRKSPAKRRVA